MAAITSPSSLQDYVLTTVTFENIAGLDGKEFGFGAGQPYARRGLLVGAAIVRAKANLPSSSHGVAAESATIYTSGHQNSLWLQFSTPQRVVGLYYRDTLATSVTLAASNSNGAMVETDTFPGGVGYAGFIRPAADISFLQLLAPHHTFGDADQSRLFIDDVSFGRSHKDLPGPTIERGPIVIVLGGIRTDGGGIVIGPNGVTPVPPSNPAFREVAAAANVLAEAEKISDGPLRDAVKMPALLLLHEGLDQFFRQH